MCKRKAIRRSLSASACISALFTLSALLPGGDSQAQTCGNLLSAGPVIFPISGSKVVLGQTITVTRYTVAAAIGDCDLLNGVAFYAQPNGTVVSALQNFTLITGSGAAA